MTHPLVDAAADAFSTALVHWRSHRRMTKKQLAAQMGFDPSYVSHVEARRHRPTEDFARRAEAVLDAGGVIWQCFREYDDARHNAAVLADKALRMPEQWAPPTGGLVVEREESELDFVDGTYRCRVVRELYNAGTEPITRFPIRVAVDRYPGEPDRSNQHHREHPLTWDELHLEAHCGGEPMRWQRKHDRDAFKEVWLLFENEAGQFPLYPGRRATVEHSYCVGDDKWGPWFQRVVRVPTRQLALRLDLPASARPIVWGVVGSLTSEPKPLQTPVREIQEGDRRRYEWSTENPPLNSRYRLEWRFRDSDGIAAPAAAVRPRPSDVMREVGILQRGNPVLERPARWLDLPDQAALAESIVTQLREAMQRLIEARPFRHGVALAAPQLGIGWAVALIRPPDSEPPTVLLNPRLSSTSIDHIERPEGCLSFLDVRGRVARPVLVEIEHSTVDGAVIITTFTAGLARVVVHAIDHLSGLLYPDRMASNARLLPTTDA
jgi:peptide deformylase